MSHPTVYLYHQRLEVGSGKQEGYININYTDLVLSSVRRVCTYCNQFSVVRHTDMEVSKVKFISLLFISLCHLSHQDKHDAPVDLCFVLDKSASITDTQFEYVLDFVVRILQDFTISSSATRVSVITYDTEPRIKFHMNRFTNGRDVMNRVKSLSRDTTGGTSTDLALKLLYTTMFLEKNGARPNVPNIVILVTDGESTDEKKTVAQAYLVKASGIFLFAVGVGNAKETELQGMASDPYEKFVYNIEHFNNLANVAAQILPKAHAVAETAVLRQKRIINLSLSQPMEKIMEGSVSQFNARANVSNCDFTTSLKWILNSTVLSTSGRFTIKDDTRMSRCSQSFCTISSTLTINGISPSDAGHLTIKLDLKTLDVSSNYYAATNITFSVVSKPLVEMSILTATVIEGGTLTPECTVSDAGRKHGRLSFKWFKNGVILNLTEDENITQVSTTESHLKLQRIVSTNTYSCQATNEAGKSNMAQCEITVRPKETPMCSSEWSKEVLWSKTAINNADKQHCPGNATGIGSRNCTKKEDKAVWNKPDLTNCVEPVFLEIAKQIDALKNGKGKSSPDMVNAAAKSLATETADSNKPDSKPITSGNMNAVISAITIMADLHTGNTSIEATSDEVENIVKTASNLLSDQNKGSWEDLLNVHKFRATQIMLTMERYSKYTEDILDNQNTIKRLNYTTENIILTLELWNHTNTDLKFPHVDNLDDGWSTDNAVIPHSTLSQIYLDLNVSHLVVSSRYYRTLDHFVPNELYKSSLGSRILSISVKNLSRSITFKTPITFEFRNQEDSLLGNQHVCAYWSYNEPNNGSSGQWSTDGCSLVSNSSNETITTCQCYHMTNFAILVSKSRPYKNSTDHRILSVLTQVGLGTSLFGLFFTIITYIVLWKSLKSDYALMIINLCAALFVANIIFLAGIEKTGDKVVCTVVAVSLHYFYLVAFFLMLAESIQLVLYIIYVFHVHTSRETNAFLSAAWGLPVIIIAICLSVTRGDGYGDTVFCWITSSHLIWAFIGPIIAVLMINFPILAIVWRKIYRSGEIHHEKKSDNFRSSLWNMVALTPLLGLTWIFGIFALDEKTIAFQYIFTILNAFQGLFIFIFHCILKKRVRDAFCVRFKIKSTSSVQSATWDSAVKASGSTSI